MVKGQGELYDLKIEMSREKKERQLYVMIYTILILIYKTISIIC